MLATCQPTSARLIGLMSYEMMGSSLKVTLTRGQEIGAQESVEMEEQETKKQRPDEQE